MNFGLVLQTVKKHVITQILTAQVTLNAIGKHQTPGRKQNQLIKTFVLQVLIRMMINALIDFIAFVRKALLQIKVSIP